MYPVAHQNTSNPLGKTLVPLFTLSIHLTGVHFELPKYSSQVPQILYLAQYSIQVLHRFAPLPDCGEEKEISHGITVKNIVHYVN